MASTGLNFNQKLSIFLGSIFYSGFSPIAPGTAGTIVTILIMTLLPELSILKQLFLIVLVTFSGVYCAFQLESIWEKDSQKITIDEAAGMLIAVFALPKTLPIWAAAFVLFRVFDIFKPTPIRTVEYLPGGWGVMADDVIAGIYANLCCWLLIWLF